jgi:hypothetical protein
MFQFPRFPQPTLFHSGRRDTPQQVPGFPIRTSTDQRSVDNSPWLIAVTHVLHRYQVPRHPPLAFHSLEKQRYSYSLCKSQTANHHHNQQQQHHTRGHQHTPTQKNGGPCQRRHAHQEQPQPGRSLKTEERTLAPTPTTHQETKRPQPADSPTDRHRTRLQPGNSTPAKHEGTTSSLERR